MENEHTYPDQLAQRIAGLSAPYQAQGATRTKALLKPSRKGLVSAAALAFVTVTCVGVWSGFHMVAGSPAAASPVAATPDVSSPSAGVAATLSAPVIGAGTLVPTHLVVLSTDAPLGLLSLNAGDVVAAGTPVFAADPASPVLPFEARILTVDPQSGSVSVMQANAYRLVLPVAEAQLSRVVIGDTADVQFDALPGQTFGADVTAIAPLVTPGRGTVNVSLTLQNPPETLRPNMAARINLCGCPSDLRLSENG